MSGTAPLVIPGFELEVAPFAIMIFVAFILFGILSAQCYFYWTTYDEDSTSLRYYVFVVWLIECLHTSFCMHILYSYFIEFYGDPIHGVAHIVWSAGATIYLEMAIVVMTEGFYIIRIYRLSGSWLVAGIPTVLLTSRVVLSCVSAAFLYIYPTWASFQSQPVPQHCLTASLSLAVATDFSITVLLAYYLQARRTAFQRTNSIIDTLMRHTIHNGALAMIVSVLVLITLHAIPSSLMFAGFVEVISKLYANSMLATLNARNRVAQIATTKGNLNSMEMPARQNTQVHVTQDKFILRDTGSRDKQYRDQKHAGINVPIMVDTTTETYEV
ncbi:hypothetical protein BC835DRAFT_1413278 [Cytidiella melzeri]|nr:hypothetical protein BC835DRAFT_1413278 [Cytidiella melzeri]